MNAESGSETTVQQQTLHAVRALGIFFIRSAAAVLVSTTIIGVGVLLVVTGSWIAAPQTINLGYILVGAGALTAIILQIGVLMSASRELNESGAGGIKKLVDQDSH